MWWNTDVFRENQERNQQHPKTWEELVQYLRLHVSIDVHTLNKSVSGAMHDIPHNTSLGRRWMQIDKVQCLAPGQNNLCNRLFQLLLLRFAVKNAYYPDTSNDSERLWMSEVQIPLERMELWKPWMYWYHQTLSQKEIRILRQLSEQYPLKKGYRNTIPAIRASIIARWLSEPAVPANYWRNFATPIRVASLTGGLRKETTAIDLLLEWALKAWYLSSNFRGKKQPEKVA